MNIQQIKNTRQLRLAIKQGEREFRLCLAGGLFSRKTIRAQRDGRFRVVNHIDGSGETLSARQLYTESNIGRAMKQGSFVISP